MNFTWQVPTKTLFGAGQLAHLHEQALPGKKALIITSRGKSVRVNGYLAETIAQLQQAGVESSVFSQVEPNPLKATVMQGGAAARAQHSDFLVALGGGSTIDAAKGIAVVATNDGDLWDYISFGTGKNKPIANKPLPILAIPTTAGTGSETDMGGVITNPDTREKTPIKAPGLFPFLAIIDPKLMVTVPAKLTAYQGFDALFHNLEGYLSKKASLMSDMITLQAVTCITQNLPKVIADGNNLATREAMAFGSYLGGLSMVVSSTVSEHSLEHSLSAFHQELPHGAGLIMLSQAYFAFLIQKNICPERFVQLAKAMGRTQATKPEEFLTALQQLTEVCGVAALKMSDYGITKEEFPHMAAIAKTAMGFLFANDRLDITQEDCVAILTAAYK